MSETDVLRSNRRWLHSRRVLARCVHGKRGSYVQGCRCDACTDAEALYRRAFKRKKAAGQ